MTRPGGLLLVRARRANGNGKSMDRITSITSSTTTTTARGGLRCYYYTSPVAISGGGSSSSSSSSSSSGFNKMKRSLKILSQHYACPSPINSVSAAGGAASIVTPPCWFPCRSLAYDSKIGQSPDTSNTTTTTATREQEIVDCNGDEEGLGTADVDDSWATKEDTEGGEWGPEEAAEAAASAAQGEEWGIPEGAWPEEENPVSTTPMVAGAAAVADTPLHWAGEWPDLLDEEDGGMEEEEGRFSIGNHGNNFRIDDFMTPLSIPPIESMEELAVAATTTHLDVTCVFDPNQEHTASDEAYMPVQDIVHILLQGYATNVFVLQLAPDFRHYAAYMIVATCNSAQHLRLLASTIAGEHKEAASEGLSELASVTGQSDPYWTVVRTEAAVVHLMLEEAREYYELEQAWAGANRAAAMDEDYLVATGEEGKGQGKKKEKEMEKGNGGGGRLSGD